MISKDKSVKEHFKDNLARKLAQKICLVDKTFADKDYILYIKKNSKNKTYSQLLELHATALHIFLKGTYKQKLATLLEILGEENPSEEGMFKNYYWALPIGTFIALYGINVYSSSMKGLEKLTKRTTAEYAIRPFVKKYPKKTLNLCSTWAKSKSFHLRRLASEGLRPKLPWAKALDIFNENPTPVFNILYQLRNDESLFVRRSVANCIRDFIKVNEKEAKKLLGKIIKDKNKKTIWIYKHATRKNILE